MPAWRDGGAPHLGGSDLAQHRHRLHRRRADLSEESRRAELALSFLSQTRRMVEMAEAAGKQEIVQQLRDILADAERVALLLTEGSKN